VGQTKFRGARLTIYPNSYEATDWRFPMDYDVNFLNNSSGARDMQPVVGILVGADLQSDFI
jgi:hypothetical protein